MRAELVEVCLDRQDEESMVAGHGSVAVTH